MKQEARPGDGLESPGFSRGEEVNTLLGPVGDVRPFTREVVTLGKRGKRAPRSRAAVLGRQRISEGQPAAGAGRSSQGAA